MSWSIETGYSHSCVCGRTWYDSDGGPCHIKCGGCDSLIDVEDADEDDRCEACAYVVCKGCHEKMEKNEINEAGYCKDCQEERAKELLGKKLSDQAAH